MVFPFSVTSEYNKKNLMEMQKVLHKRTARLCFMLSLLGAALFILGTIISSGFCMFCGVFWWLFFMGMRHQAARKSTKQKVKSDLKNFGAPVKTTVKFYATMFIAKNETTQKEQRAQYEDVERLIMTNSLYIIGLADRVTLMVDRKNLTQEEDTELWAHLCDKCTAAEITA